MVGLVVLIVIAVAAFVGPSVWSYGATEMTGELALPPSWEHPFGTDRAGYDQLARVLRAVQRSVLVGFAVALLSTVLGVSVGAAAGYRPGVLDAVLMRLTDLVLTVPTFAVLAVLAGAGGGTRHWFTIAVIVSALSWERKARLVRSSFVELREREFVLAARAAGARPSRIVVRHLLPNVAAPVIVAATLTVASAIAAEAALAYLGLGITPPDVSLGLLVQRGQRAALTLPWLFYIPGLVVVVLVLSVGLVGDALRSALDPSSLQATVLREPITSP